MRTQHKYRHIVMGASLIMAAQGFGQASVPSNSGGPGNYLGWDSGTPQPLEVRHDGNYPIQWWTDSIQRMELKETRTTGSTINGYANVDQTGYLGLSGEPLFFNNTVGPFSRLHLVEPFNSSANTYAQQYGFRRWMRNGKDQTFINKIYATFKA